MWSVAWAFLKKGGWELLLLLGALIPVVGWWWERRSHKGTKRDLGRERVRRKSAEEKSEDHRVRADTAQQLADAALRARDQEKADRLRIHETWHAEKRTIEKLKKDLEDLAAQEGAAAVINEAFDLPDDQD